MAAVPAVVGADLEARVAPEVTEVPEGTVALVDIMVPVGWVTDRLPLPGPIWAAGGCTVVPTSEAVVAAAACCR